jgi:hypothetical protein
VLGPGLALGEEPTAAATSGRDCVEAEKRAERCGTPARADSADATAVRTGESGLVVVRDKDSGELRAPEGNEAAELLRRAMPANNFSDKGLVQVPLPRGGYSMDLQGRFQEYFVVVRDADGTLRPGCVNDPAQAGLAKTPAAAPSPQGEDR